MTGGVRPWERVERGLVDRITSGELKPGGPVPSKPVLAREFGVAERTAPRALASLAGQGVIRRVPGTVYHVCLSFSYVPGGAAVQEQLMEALRWVWDGAYQIGASADGGLEAWRMDGSGTLHADTPEELRNAVREDYGLRPVPAL